MRPSPSLFGTGPRDAAPPRTARNFQEILELIWWRLDCALDEEMIRCLRCSGARGARAGNDRNRRSSLLAERHRGLPERHRGRLCRGRCAVLFVLRGHRSQRGGGNTRRTGENERFLRSGGRGFVAPMPVSPSRTPPSSPSPVWRPTSAPGAHSCLRGPRRQSGRRATRVSDERRLVARHCVHLDRPLRGTVAHNPRSNMNNAVGYARPARLENTVVLGTDGIGGTCLKSSASPMPVIGRTT